MTRRYQGGPADGLTCCSGGEVVYFDEHRYELTYVYAPLKCVVCGSDKTARGNPLTGRHCSPTCLHRRWELPGKDEWWRKNNDAPPLDKRQR